MTKTENLKLREIEVLNEQEMKAETMSVNATGVKMTCADGTTFTCEGDVTVEYQTINGENRPYRMICNGSVYYCPSGSGGSGGSGGSSGSGSGGYNPGPGSGDDGQGGGSGSSACCVPVGPMGFGFHVSDLRYGGNITSARYGGTSKVMLCFTASTPLKYAPIRFTVSNGSVSNFKDVKTNSYGCATAVIDIPGPSNSNTVGIAISSTTQGAGSVSWGQF